MSEDHRKEVHTLHIILQKLPVFPTLSNVACYAIDSHPLFHNIIILYQN